MDLKFRKVWLQTSTLKNIKDWERQYPEVSDFKYYKKFACVSCWYESVHESAAMWEMYGKAGQGIAIRSTEERIRGSLDDGDLVFAKVKYIDFLRKKAKINMPYDAFLYKRIEFKSEHEFRIAFFQLPESTGIDRGFPRFGSPEKQDGFPESGENREVNIELLIDRIVLSPYSKRWYRDVITNVMARYHLESLTVAESELGPDPVYPEQ